MQQQQRANLFRLSGGAYGVRDFYLSGSYFISETVIRANMYVVLDILLLIEFCLSPLTTAWEALFSFFYIMSGMERGRGGGIGEGR
jgi:hypothetical protein